MLQCHLMVCREATRHDEDVATHAPRTLEYWVQIPRDSPRTRSCRTWVPTSPAAYENPGRRAVLRRLSNTGCPPPAPAPAPAPVAAPALVSRPLWLCCRATGCLDSVVRRRKLSPARFTISADPAPPTVAARTVAGCTSISGAKPHLPHNVAQCSSSIYWTTTIPKRRACWNAQPQHGRGKRCMRVMQCAWWQVGKVVRTSAATSETASVHRIRLTPAAAKHSTTCLTCRAANRSDSRYCVWARPSR